MSAWNRHVSLAVLFLGLASWVGCNRSNRPAPLTGDHSFSLIYSQANFGNIEPCSCNNRTRGGFPRRQSFLKQVAQEKKALLRLDAGNSLYSESISHPSMMPQAKSKAMAIARAFVMTGLDAYVFGDRDLVAGGNYFREIVKETGLPVLAANVIDRKTGKPVFGDYKIFDLDGVKVAVIGLVSPELRPVMSEANEAGAKLVKAAEQPILLDDAFEDHDVKFEDPIAVAQKLVPELRKQAHLVAVLSHLPPRMSREFEQVVPGVDFLVGSHKPSNNVNYAVQGQSLYLTATMNGTNLGVVDFNVRNGGLIFSDYTVSENARKVLPTLTQWVDDIQQKYGTSDSAQIMSLDYQTGLRFENLTRRVAEYQKLVAEADKAAESSFRHYAVTLDGVEYKDDPEMSQYVRDFRRSLASLYSASNTARAKEIEEIPGSRSFAGGARCAECHRPQQSFWQNTRHAHAWQTMLDQSAEFDLECIVCHTVGYMKPGGFDRPDRVAGFENVQCEDCHSMGSAHVAGFGFLEDKNIDASAEDMLCEKCHNSEHSPDFRRETYVARVSCPPIDPKDPLIRGAFGKARERLQEQLARKNTPLRVFTAHVDLSMRLDRFDEAFDLAQKGLEQYPGARALEIGAARAMDGLGRSGEALQRMYGVYELDNGSAAVLKEIIELLLFANDTSVRDPKAADSFIQWGIEEHGKSDLAFHQYRAQSLHAQGEIEAGINAINDILSKTGGRGAANIELLAAWTAELGAVREFSAPPPLAQPPSGP